MKDVVDMTTSIPEEKRDPTGMPDLDQAYGALDCADRAQLNLGLHLIMIGRPDLAEKVKGIVVPLLTDVERELDKTTETRRKMQRR